MVRYFYAWTPLFAVGTVSILTLPWLGLIALFVVALVAVPALAFATVFLPYILIRAIARSWQGRSSASPRTAAALAPATRQPAFRNGV